MLAGDICAQVLKKCTKYKFDPKVPNVLEWFSNST